MCVGWGGVHAVMGDTLAGGDVMKKIDKKVLWEVQVFSWKRYIFRTWDVVVRARWSRRQDGLRSWASIPGIWEAVTLRRLSTSVSALWKRLGRRAGVVTKNPFAISNIKRKRSNRQYTRQAATGVDRGFLLDWGYGPWWDRRDQATHSLFPVSTVAVPPSRLHIVLHKSSLSFMD